MKTSILAGALFLAFAPAAMAQSKKGFGPGLCGPGPIAVARKVILSERLGVFLVQLVDRLHIIG